MTNHRRNDRTNDHAQHGTVGGRRRRRGFLSMEFAMVLPLLFVVLLAAVQFSMLFFARGDLVDACRVGARMATQPSVLPEDVEQRVREVLEPRFRSRARINVRTGAYPGDVVAVAVSVPMRSAAPDLLWPIGIRLAGRELHAETRMIRE